MTQFRPGLGGIPPVVKNLLIINVILWIGSILVRLKFDIGLEEYLGLYYFGAEKFQPYQIITHMFMHSYFNPQQGIVFFHILFNMFALWMFGRVVENVWGAKRFFIYYMVCGVGAAILHYLVQYFEMAPVLAQLDDYLLNPDHNAFDSIVELVQNNFISPEIAEHGNLYLQKYYIMLPKDPSAALQVTVDFVKQYKVDYLNTHLVVGASGAVFGILLAFGMLFPNARLMLLFPPIPIKAKYAVIGYGILELTLGISGFSWDNVAHFAHLGGMIFGYILIKFWGKHQFNRWD